jgi:hypothetical protein
LVGVFYAQQSQLRHAVYVEDYEEAAKLKVAIAAAANNDSVGKVITLLKVGILMNEGYTVS